MPSIRKRIGYLPSPNVQNLINQIATNKKLSQSKVVGILVEEALSARGLIDYQKIENLNKHKLYKNERNIQESLLNYDDLDELISDKGISYNKKEYRIHKPHSEDISTESKEGKYGEIFEQFKQFIQFQKMLEGK